MTTDEITENATEVETSVDYERGYEDGKTALKAEIEASDRDVSKLVNLESWSCLSDSEVRKLIDFKVNIALSSDEAKAHRTAAQSMTELAEVTMGNVCQDTANVLQCIVDSMTNYQGVTPNSVTSQLETVQEV